MIDVEGADGLFSCALPAPALIAIPTPTDVRRWMLQQSVDDVTACPNRKGDAVKKIAIAITLLVIAFSFTLAQKTTTAAKRKTVSAASIAKLPAGKTYEVDLTRKGTIYNFNGDATDFSRVTVRTTAGVKTMAELLKQSEANVKGQVMVGTPSDMRGQKLSPTRIGGGTVNFNCSGIICGCTGDVDCNNMFSGGACGNIAWCYNNRCYCVARA
jgi:hypothetical protein